ncbi:MAG TPA: hypothetical protein VGV64_08505 [Thermoplasmata archaeon]|nr:hypothetical protein [Thermoplasmata archaeon]
MAGPDRPDVAGGGSIVLLDTNALLLPFVSGLDLLGEIDRTVGRASVRVPSSVLGELERLERRQHPNAGVARTLARRFPVVPTRARGDAGILDCALRTGGWVVTADRTLASLLRSRGIGVLAPRDRSRLVPRPAARPVTVMSRPPLVRTSGSPGSEHDRRGPPARRAVRRVRQRGRRGL